MSYSVATGSLPTPGRCAGSLQHRSLPSGAQQGSHLGTRPLWPSGPRPRITPDKPNPRPGAARRSPMPQGTGPHRHGPLRASRPGDPHRGAETGQPVSRNGLDVKGLCCREHPIHTAGSCPLLAAQLLAFLCAQRLLKPPGPGLRQCPCRVVGPQGDSGDPGPLGDTCHVREGAGRQAAPTHPEEGPRVGGSQRPQKMWHLS